MRDRLLLTGLLLLLLWQCSLTAQAGSLWVILLPGTNLSDWQHANAPALHRLMAEGSLALMNTRTARLPNDQSRESPESAALTLGAGSRAAGGPEITDFLPPDRLVPGTSVTARALYTRRTASTPAPAAWVNPAWARVLSENSGQGYDLHPGNLAAAIARAGDGIRSAGGPLADAVATTETGWVRRTPPADIGASQACVVDDAGSNLAAADGLLRKLMASRNVDRVIALSPTPSDRAYRRGDRLCPLVVWGRGVPRGLLYSESTRHLGLVTDTDLAVNITDTLGVPLADFPTRPFGDQPWRFRPTPDGITALMQLDRNALSQWDGLRALPPLAVLLGLWMVGVTLWGRRSVPAAWASAVPPAILCALSVSTSPLTLAVWLPLALLAAVWVRSIAWAGLLAGLLVADLLLGDPLMQRGLLGYSAIEGARYYGMGNEAMGALIGATLVSLDAVLRRLTERRLRRLCWLGPALIIAFLGAPQAGAKAGGLVVALLTFGAYGWLRSGRRLSAPVALGGVAAALFLLLGLAFVDRRVETGHVSHFGQAVARLQTGGLGEWGDIIVRKLTVEGHLLTHSAWAVPVWGGLGALLWRRPSRENDQPMWAAGLVATASCLLFNDAGAVAGSLCLLVLWSTVSVRQENGRLAPAGEAA